MFSFFTKKNIIPQDFSVLGTDLHSHLIPGIDDGSPDVETSLELIHDLWQMGFTKVITTPHVMSDYYPNSSTTIRAGLDTMRAALATAGIPVELYGSAEYHADENFDRLIQEGDLLALPGNKILFELSFYGASPSIEHTIFMLRTKGYRPILAHPERYKYFHGKIEALHRFKDMGCELQVNLLSLSGHYGDDVKKWAEKLLKENMVDYLATDMHHKRHAILLDKLRHEKLIQQILRKYPFKNQTL